MLKVGFGAPVVLAAAAIPARTTVSGTILRLIAFAAVLLTAGTAAAAVVFQVDSWQDYLRLVPWSCHGDYRPVLLTDEPAAIALAGYLGGGSIHLYPAGVDSLLAAAWPDAPAVVAAGADRRLATVAAAIAAALDRPLRLTVAAAGGDSAGEVVVEGGGQNGRLHGLAPALAYYDGLVGDEGVVLCADDDYTCLAAAVAARHRSALSCDLAGAAARRPRSLTWVVDPGQVTTAAVRRLYREAAGGDSTLVYAPAIGVITARTPAEASALLARTFCYDRLRGAWRRRITDCSAPGAAGDDTSREGPWSIRRVRGTALTADSLADVLAGSAYVNLFAHGSPSGFMLAGSNWPDATPLPPAAPLVFVGESCETADIASAGVANSVALRLIGAGAVAYVGSLEIGGVAVVGDHPFACCTPDCPLGEHVRLQNAARMQLVDSWPHTLLIGDPLFHQAADERVSCRIEKGELGTVVRISGAADSLSTAIAVDLPGSGPVSYAKVETASGSAVYTLGWPQPLAAAPASGKMRVLIPWSAEDGTLTVYGGPLPLSLRLFAVLENGRMGVRSLLDDVPTATRGAPVVILAIAVLIALGAALRICRSPRWRAASAVSVLIGSGVGAAAWWSDVSTITSVATAGGAAAVAALLDLHRARGGRLAAALGLFLAPMLVELGFVGMMGVSAKIIRMLIAGMGLLAAVFLISFGLGRLVLAALRANPTSASSPPASANPDTFRP